MQKVTHFLQSNSKICYWWASHRSDISKFQHFFLCAFKKERKGLQKHKNETWRLLCACVLLVRRKIHFLCKSIIVWVRADYLSCLNYRDYEQNRKWSFVKFELTMITRNFFSNRPRQRKKVYLIESLLNILI